MTQQIATCKKATNKGTLIEIEYKTGKSVLIMTIPIGEPDFEIAKQLVPGDKFIIESRNIKLESTQKFQFLDNQELPITYIIKKIPER